MINMMLLQVKFFRNKFTDIKCVDKNIIRYETYLIQKVLNIISKNR